MGNEDGIYWDSIGYRILAVNGHLQQTLEITGYFCRRDSACTIWKNVLHIPAQVNSMCYKQTEKLLIIVKAENMFTLLGRCGFLTAFIILDKHRFGQETEPTVVCK